MLILENDSNAEVRRAVLSCIAMSPRTLPKVIKRTRDIRENVRKQAYQVATNAVKYGGINVHVHMQQHNKVVFFTWLNTCSFSISKELSIFVFYLRFWLTKFTSKHWPSHREFVYCSRVSMTPQVMVISVPLCETLHLLWQILQSFSHMQWEKNHFKLQQTVLFFYY